MRARLIIILIPLIALILACGKKGPPHLPEPEKVPSPVAIDAIRRAGEITLRWSGAAATEYVITRTAYTGESSSMKTKEMTIRDTGISDTSGYVYTVAGRSESGVMSRKTVQVDISPMPALTIPAELKASLTNDGVRLTWKPSAGDFNVYRATGDEPFGDTPLNFNRIEGGAYDDRPYLKGDVRYVIRAARLTGDVRYEGAASGDVRMPVSRYVPAKSTGLKGFYKAADVVLMWDEARESWATGYEVLRADRAGAFTVIGSTRIPTFTDPAPGSGEFTYKVRAIGPGGAGPLSDPVRVKP